MQKNARYQPWILEELSPEMIQKAETELGETDEVRSTSLRKLRQLIEKEPDFKPISEDKFLLRFLRARKFDVQKAFKTLCNYYHYKQVYSRVVTDFLPSEMEYVLDYNGGTILPFRDCNGSIIMTCRLGAYDTNKVTSNDLLISFWLAAELVLRFDPTQVCGVVVLIDMAGITLRQMQQMSSPRVLYRFTKAVQDCIPLRLKAFHIINGKGPFQIIFNIMNLFLSEKMKKRFRTHEGDMETLYEHLPREILPSDFGGHLGPSDNTDLMEIFRAQEAQFRDQIGYGFPGKAARK